MNKILSFDFHDFRKELPLANDECDRYLIKYSRGYAVAEYDYISDCFRCPLSNIEFKEVIAFAKFPYGS